jgi:pantothenate synthetase
VLLSLAAKIGKTRLLDNIVLVGSHEDLGLPET